MNTIYCYTATGNSLYIAKHISEKIQAEIIPISNKEQICNSDVIGFVYPVFFWGMPLSMEQFVKDLKIQNKNAYIFAVYTYGGTALFCAAVLNNLLKKKNTHLSFISSVKMVENYIPSFKVNDNPAIWDNADKKIEIISKSINERKNSKFHTGTFINKIIHHLYPAHNKNCSKDFAVKKSCIGCGLCSKICPTQNIKINNNVPIFENHCDHCLGCLNMCPYDAIEYKNKTNGKTRYKNTHIKPDEIIEWRNKYK